MNEEDRNDGGMRNHVRTDGRQIAYVEWNMIYIDFQMR